MFCFGLSKFKQLPIYYSLLIMKSRRSRGFTVGDRVRGLIGSIGTSTGVITKLLKGSRVEVRWDEGPCAGVTEPRSVDQLVAHISTSLAPDVVDRNDTDRRCGLPGCDEPVFIWDQNVNLPRSGVRGVYLCSEHVNFSQEDVNQFVRVHIREQEVAVDDNPPDALSDPDGFMKYVT